ncbi:MAG: hypothetical protein K6G88_01390 [Lachnospiraceae bacterium]|nr:hypothetical protein [Lachnospiraceae bacterium]
MTDFQPKLVACNREKLYAKATTEKTTTEKPQQVKITEKHNIKTAEKLF